MSNLSDLMMVIDWLVEKKTPTGPVEAALQRLRDAAQPDWPPARSAVGLEDGTLGVGSTGQQFVVHDHKWVRIGGK